MDAPRRLNAEDPDLVHVLDLIRASFSYMEGVVNPPSSVHELTMEKLEESAAKAEVWAIGSPVVGCMILTPKPPYLYLGKLAIAEAERGKGLSRILIETACDRAKASGLHGVELGTRIELTSNQRAFTAMGFAEAFRECHPGFDRHTSIVYRRTV